LASSTETRNKVGKKKMGDFPPSALFDALEAGIKSFQLSSFPLFQREKPEQNQQLRRNLRVTCSLGKSETCTPIEVLRTEGILSDWQIGNYSREPDSIYLRQFTEL
jgi:hypothetical protein